ncbi:hypothetical protein [Streptomyces sp. CRN 30]|uniref:hypothetical protein n=1 Tax=Streptomyces sp. CRN 30 TaxID=3075613 RepID=UPI0039C2B76E
MGDLTVDCGTWASPDGSGQRLTVLPAEPGSPSHGALRILASWTTGQAGADRVGRPDPLTSDAADAPSRRPTPPPGHRRW